MEPTWFAVVLLAALLHAGWNALVKVAADRLVVLTAVALGQGLFGLLLIPFTAIPAPEAWPYIAISTVLHYSYCAFLYQSYRFGDLSQVYPLARGLAPVLVTLGAALFAGEILEAPKLAGVALASLGICGLAFVSSRQTRMSLPALGFAAGTGVMVAAYTVSDGIGVRLSGAPLGFIAWLFIFEFPIVAFTTLVRGRRLIGSLAGEPWKFAGCAAFSTAAYALVIFASAFAPLAMVSAVRETSVVMAAMIGVFVLGERPWQQRIGAAGIVAVGVMLLVGQG
jgi:drug/metabolite transporter (DMT)-like permease